MKKEQLRQEAIQRFGENFINELQGPALELIEIANKTQQAIRIRAKLIDRLSKVCELISDRLKNKKPGSELINIDRSMVNFLGATLDREEEFIDVVRKGSKRALKLLKRMPGLIEETNIEPNQKKLIIEVVLNFQESMRFAKNILKDLEYRIKLGRRMLNNRFGTESYRIEDARDFIDSFGREKELDERLSKKLKGELNKVYSPLNKFLVACTQGAMGIAASAAGLVVLNTGSWWYSEGIRKLMKQDPVAYIDSFKDPGYLFIMALMAVASIVFAIAASSDDSVLKELEIEKNMFKILKK